MVEADTNLERAAVRTAALAGAALKPVDLPRQEPAFQGKVTPVATHSAHTAAVVAVQALSERTAAMAMVALACNG